MFVKNLKQRYTEICLYKPSLQKFKRMVNAMKSDPRARLTELETCFALLTELKAWRLDWTEKDGVCTANKT